LAERYAAIGHTSDNPMIFAAGGDTLRKAGSWVVPPFIKIQGGFGSVVLDMQRASTLTEMIGVEISGGLGEITIIIPEGWGADLTAVTPGLGSRRSTVAGAPTPGMPFLYLHGTMTLGSLKIRYPKNRDRRRLARDIAREQRQATRALR
jgi:hypothetical protein